MENKKQARLLGMALLVAGSAVPVLAQPNKPTIIEFDAPGAGTGAYQGTLALQINPAGLLVGYYFTGSGTVGAYGFVRTLDGNFETFAAPNAYLTYPQSMHMLLVALALSSGPGAALARTGGERDVAEGGLQQQRSVARGSSGRSS
jgi:hypothetical protein